jgi:transposase
MTNYREILRLKNLGINNSQIAESMAISRPTVIAALRRAAAQGLDWQAVESLSERELAELLFPQGNSKPGYKIPDYDYVHRELAKPGVTQQLLWFEYCDQCHAAGEVPYQLTQFKTHYREYVTKTKATMHIHRNPGELMEVDWALSVLTDKAHYR